MKLEVKIELLKFCFAVFNAVFLVLGLSVAGCGVWILFDAGSFLNVLSSEELRVVAGGLLLIGALVVLLSVFGCVGANSESRLMLLMYLGCLIILVLGQLFVLLLLLVSKDKIEQSLNAAVDLVIVQYGDSRDSDSRLMDNVQHYGRCCGRMSPSDWLRNSYIQSLNLTGPDVLPCSCFSSYHRRINSSWCSEQHNFTEPLYGRGNGTFNQGCSQNLRDWLQNNFLTIVGMDFSLILIQVIQFVIAVFLYRAFGEKQTLKRTDLLCDQDHAHPDPDHTPHDDLDYGEQNYAYIDPDGSYRDLDNTNLVEPNLRAYHPDD